MTREDDQLRELGELDAVDPARVVKQNPMDWLPPGPVARAFVLAPEPVTAIMGPLGSGKTTAAGIKGLLCSCVVPRSPVDGVRYARGVVVRDTYRNLEMNTIPSWHERFPRELGSWKGGGGGEPGKHVIDFEIAADEIVHMEVIFAAIGDHNVKSFADGFQCNWVWLASADTLPADTIKFMIGRTGRWPPPQHRPADWKAQVRRWRKLWAEFNAPDIDNHLHGDEEKTHPGFVEHVPKGWKLFTQPGGLSPEAENIENLPPEYYSEMAGERWYLLRFRDNKWGYSRGGQPVYESWSDELHVAPLPLKFDPARELILGLDAGRDPRAVALQRSFTARVAVLDEFVPLTRMGAKEFGHALSAWLAEKFSGARVRAFADPSSVNPNDTTNDEDGTWIDIVAETAKIKIKPAPSNALTVRLEAVTDLLTGLSDGKPDFLLSPNCRVLRRGFNSGYCYAKVKEHGSEKTTDAPMKNIYSHPHDALQYACLGSSDWRELRGREKARRRPAEPDDDYHPHDYVRAGR